MQKLIFCFAIFSLSFSQHTQSQALKTRDGKQAPFKGGPSFEKLFYPTNKEVKKLIIDITTTMEKKRKYQIELPQQPIEDQKIVDKEIPNKRAEAPIEEKELPIEELNESELSSQIDFQQLKLIFGWNYDQSLNEDTNPKNEFKWMCSEYAENNHFSEKGLSKAFCTFLDKYFLVVVPDLNSLHNEFRQVVARPNADFFNMKIRIYKETIASLESLKNPSSQDNFSAGQNKVLEEEIAKVKSLLSLSQKAVDDLFR